MTVVVIDGRVRTHELRWLGRFIEYRVYPVSVQLANGIPDMQSRSGTERLYFQLFISWLGGWNHDNSNPSDRASN
jgi:hypothetical protein